MEYGLLGKSLKHSFSKQIHESLWADSYELISLNEDELDAFMQKRDFKGINITIPYKQKVMPYCDKIDGTAKKVGCVNTILKEKNGSLTGYNTDLFGLKYAAARAKIEIGGKSVLIFGTGATSKTATAVCSAAGARSTNRISRSGECTYADIPKFINSEIIINTTPIGMYPDNGKTITDLSEFSNVTGVVDVVYNPLRTMLVYDALQKGVKATGGLAMLVAQAVRAAELFTGAIFDEAVTESLIKSTENRMGNIVLIGMPGSGKTSLGKIAADKLGRPFWDTDEMVAVSAGMTIPEIFEKYGEPHFRTLEAQAIAQAGSQNGVVIATGGGAVMSARNRYMLKQNGKICYIKRDIDRLETKGRPLSVSREALAEIFKKRIATYESFCDIIIGNNAAAQTAAEQIWRKFQ